MGLLGEQIWTQIPTKPCKTPKKEAEAPQNSPMVHLVSPVSRVTI